MRSIKEKAEENLEQNKDEILCVYDRYAGFVDGANYVLEKFVDIVNKNTKPNGMEDRAQMASDMIILIKQLKK